MPRKTVIIWICICSAYTICSGQQGIYTIPIGGYGGTEFSMSPIREIGLIANNVVNQININGKKYGTGGGIDYGSITLASNEYINKVEYRASNKLDWVSFCTNLGRCISGGSTKGTYGKLENIRLLSLGGKSGTIVDRLHLMYVSDYRPSQLVCKNVPVILSFKPPFGEEEEYILEEHKKLQSLEKTIETMGRIYYDANIEGEFIAKMGVKFGFELKHTTIDKYKEEVVQRLEGKRTRKQTIPGGNVGVTMTVGDLLDGANGTYWVFPTGPLVFSVTNMSDTRSFLNAYDLTFLLYTQVPELSKYKKEKHGLVYYEQPNNL